MNNINIFTSFLDLVGFQYQVHQNQINGLITIKSEAIKNPQTDVCLYTELDILAQFTQNGELLICCFDGHPCGMSETYKKLNTVFD